MLGIFYTLQRFLRKIHCFSSFEINNRVLFFSTQNQSDSDERREQKLSGKIVVFSREIDSGNKSFYNDQNLLRLAFGIRYLFLSMPMTGEAEGEGGEGGMEG